MDYQHIEISPSHCQVAKPRPQAREERSKISPKQNAAVMLLPCLGRILVVILPSSGAPTALVLFKSSKPSKALTTAYHSQAS